MINKPIWKPAYFERILLRRWVHGSLVILIPERLGLKIADPLAATVLALRSDGLVAAIVSLDWCLIDEDETAESA